MLLALCILALGAYGVAIWRRGTGPLAGAALAAACLGLAAHAALLVQLGWQDGQLWMGLGMAWSVEAWQSAVLLVVLGIREPLAPLAPAVFTFAGLGLLMGVFLGSPAVAVATGKPGVVAHVLSSLLAYGLLTLAMLQALCVALQDHRLRAGGAVDRLPPIRTMERLLFVLVGIGFGLLSLSLITGLLATDNLFAQHLAHKTVFTLAAWLVFGLLLVGRWWRGWRGRVAVGWTLGGYASLALAYFGAKWVLEMLLGQHWG